MPEKMPVDYREAVEYIEELPRFTRKHPLEHTKEFMKRLGNPAHGCKVIHVAGTNGKGSVCAYIQAILQAEGKRCGFFTSPHLISVNERIQIDRQPIEDQLFFEVFRKVSDAAQDMEKEGLGHPSYFEFLYGMGMETFDRTAVEYIVLETGLGGRLDATNSVEDPLLTVITSVSLDHTDILGNTIAEVAYEKAGIIKPGVPVFFDGSNEEVSEVVRKEALKKNAPCREISKNAYEIREVRPNYIAFSRQNAYDKDVMWRVTNCGCYQAMNTEIAVEAMEYILQAGEDSSRTERWINAVAAVRWEGRMEEVEERLIVDGAHNPGAVEAFAETLQMLGADQLEEPVLVFSAAADKKYEKMIEYLCRNVKAKAYIVTEIEDKRRVPASELGHIFRKYTDRKVLVCAALEDAVRRAFEERGGGRVYCLGSLYLAGMVKKLAAGGKIHA